MDNYNVRVRVQQRCSSVSTCRVARETVERETKSEEGRRETAEARVKVGYARARARDEHAERLSAHAIPPGV